MRGAALLLFISAFFPAGVTSFFSAHAADKPAVFGEFYVDSSLFLPGKYSDCVAFVQSNLAGEKMFDL
ncbi:hypothetical protein BLD49_08180 [Erwinia sp. OLMDSP33]|nr:hypothetical protein BLD47_07065 [Erwinia sp. OLCASP19]PIJ84963.1 hypothetical protein BLD46_06905 [Erwinia sp. OLMTSP26]PIJ86567.1 hypothetical protein BLD49_08180 [Erwinia sp. OLMDSP33]PIJ90209.1 hypothetical protein BL249_13555 [Erwinia sp. OLFS4]